MKQRQLIVIGGGVMGMAIVAGAIGAGVIDSDRVIVVEPDAKRRRDIARSGVRAFERCGAVKRAAAATILLSVKPQVFRERDVAADMRSIVRADDLVISIMAGVRLAAISRLLGTKRVVRAMPNTAARVGLSATAWCAASGASATDRSVAVELLRSIGPTVEQIPERLMDAFTALAGSGPAYLFYLTEAMMLAGRRVGFSEKQADRITRATIAGAAALLDGADGEHASPVALRAAVTSKGGTTEAACAMLDARKVKGVVIAAVSAARDRGRVLGRM